MGSNWIGAGQGMIDPLKESKAMETRLKNRITNRQQEKQAYDGGDWRQTAANYAKEDEYMTDLGIHPDKLELQKLETMQQTVEEPPNNSNNDKTNKEVVNETT